MDRRKGTRLQIELDRKAYKCESVRVTSRNGNAQSIPDSSSKPKGSSRDRFKACRVGKYHSCAPNYPAPHQKVIDTEAVEILKRLNQSDNPAFVLIGSTGSANRLIKPRRCNNKAFPDAFMNNAV